ncbi:Ig-like domain repeat protein [uncultured Methanobrevibacter sp.]|uniref:Ig-like domain repeat protein n=1 Tax=uncultured Methanobrevibacter sp. TaxID=253161 RepID=UPI0026381C5D|nr:Ig-like domain repeat protein [uncultured Methanobrevibacter sp.]
MILALLILIFGISSAYANDLENTNLTASVDESLDLEVDSQNDLLTEQSGVITVNDWNDLQKYCSLDDKDYVLKLKENTNYYPTDPEDNSYQIKVRNNVTIIGSSGAYFGDANPEAIPITYLAIDVPENSGLGITLRGVTFKWIATEYQPNAVFLQMAGNSNNLIEDCYFTNCTLDGGHSSLVYLLRGYASIENSTFTNIISDFGCVSIYDPMDNVNIGVCNGARMDITDSYFEGNYAKTEPGCINNCGQLVVRNTTFYKNAAFWWAGAIHTHESANTTIYDSNFTDNLAGWNGGALCTYSYLQIYNTTFVGNNCTTDNGGGAIFAYDQPATIGTPQVYIKDSLFKDNENLCWSLSELSTNGIGRGGGISFTGKGSVTLLNNTFIKNSAAIGTAVCIIAQGDNNPTDTTIIGNRFINHTRVGDVLIVNLNSVSSCEIKDNFYLNNSIEFSKLKLTADEKVGDEVTLHIDASLTNEKYYDSDILDKSDYDVYMDGNYYRTVTGRDFTINVKNIENSQVYIVPCISNSKSNEVSIGTPKQYIFVSQKYGNDDNNGSTRQSPVATIAKACQLARESENIIIMDGTYSESNITIDYNLIIKGEDDVKFTGNLPNTIFTLTNNSDFKISNIIFEDMVFAAKNTGIIRQSTGFTEIDNCEFNNIYRSSGTTLIEARSINVFNSKFANNSKNQLMLIKSNEFLIDNCTFLNNMASDSTYYSLISTGGEKTGVKGTVTNSIFKSNTVKYGCIFFDASNRPLTITNTQFIANRVSSIADHASCIKVANSPEVKIDSCAFNGNVDLGTRSAVIYVDGNSANVYVSNSIIVNNSYENSNKVVFSASKSDYLGVYRNLSGNWWGNTWQNYTVVPAAYSSACGDWLFLNVSANATSISKNEKVLITFDLNNLVTRAGDISYYDASNLADVIFKVKTIGGISSDEELLLVNGTAQLIYTLTSFYGEITADYYGVQVTFNFTHLRSKVNMTVNANDSYVGKPVIVEVEFSEDVTGNLTIANQTKPVAGFKTLFEVNNLSSGENVIEVFYSGDDHWEPSAENVTVTVYKNNSTTKITSSDVEIGKEVTLTVEVTETATGNVTLIINNENKTLTLTNSNANYTIKSIPQGNYNITAIYDGDSKYLSSRDNINFGVGRIKPEFSLNVSDIVYGQDAIIKVVLNRNATGYVYVDVNGKNKTSKLENGQANVSISNLSVGPKTVYVSYDGDNYYDSINDTASFNVLKANTTLTIVATDIKVGAKENIEVTVPSGVTGKVTIVCGEYNITKEVNVLGKVLWTLSDLPVGPYTVSATLISDNYNNAGNTTNFTVSDYQTPQWPNQGYDVGNDGKSPYYSNSNGAIVWSYNTNGNVTENIVIDSEGNICIVTSSGVYSIDDAGKERWNYNYVSENISGIAISRDVVIVPISANSLYFVNQTSGQRYGYSHVYQASSLFAPIVDSKSNIYVSSEYQHASGDYKLVIVPYSLWEYGGNPIMISLGKSQPVSAPVLVGDKYAVIACNDGIKIIDLDKKEISSSLSGNTQSVRPAVSSESIIYAVLNNNIQAMTPQGNIIWKTPITSLGGQLALDEDNGLYFINSKGNLYKYNLVDGSEKLISSLNFTSGMLIGTDGNVYVGLNEMLYAFDDSGNILWKSDMGEKIVGTPVMNKDGIIYLTTSNALKSIGKSSLLDPKFDVNISDITLGENASVIITVHDDLTGTFNVEVDLNNYGCNISENNITITVPNLSVGNKTAHIVYSGDGRFKSKQISYNFTVFRGSKIPTEVNLTVGEVVVGEDVSVGICVVNASGDVLVVFDNANKTISLDKNGSASFVIEKIGAGRHVLDVVYLGSDIYEMSNASEIIDVSKLASEVNLTVGDVVVGEDVSVGICVVNASGDVLVVFDNVNETVSLDEGGYASFVIEKIGAGRHVLDVVYLGSDIYEMSNASEIIDVSKVASEINLTVGDIKIGADTPINIEIPGATGEVYVYVDRNEYIKQLIGCKTNFNVSSLAVGSHNINVVYYGDESHYFATVSKFIPASAVLSSFRNIVVSGKGIISAVLVDGNGNGIGDAEITYKIGESNYTTATDENGEFEIKVNSNSIVEIVYEGADLILPSKISITLKLATSRLATSVVGDNYTQPAIEYAIGERGGNFTVQLIDQNGKPLANKVVYIGYNGKCLERTTDENGFARVQINLVAENRLTFAVAFLGDDDYAASMSVYLITITKKAVTINAPAKSFKASAKTKSYTVTLKTDKNKFDGKTYFAAGKKVTMSLNGKTYTAKTDSNGKATFKLDITKKGTYSANIVYAGDNTYSSAKASSKIKIN